MTVIHQSPSKVYRNRFSATSPVFLAMGISSIVFFHLDIYFPIEISIALMSLVILYFIRQFKTKRLGMLMLVLLLVYLLPFIHIPPYLWFDFNSKPLILWGLAVNPYMFDKSIIKLTAMLGAVGGLGMGFGVSFLKSRLVRDTGLNSDGSLRSFRSLATPIWLIWVFIGVGLSWLSAPQETIFTSTYATSDSLIGGLNFSSAWMMSYVILTFAFCDTLLDRNSIRKTIKRTIIWSAIAFIVVFLQLLRGDRESVSWVFSLGIVYFYWASVFTHRKLNIKVPWIKLIFLVSALVFISLIVGGVRHGLVGANLGLALGTIVQMFNSSHFQLSNFFHGTWSAVLLTPLSVAGDHINNLLPLKWGKDYLNFFLSLPPGFLADAFGYVRPIDSFAGPAWEMRYGIGGNHASVVPFMNFRMVGVFLIPALWSYIFVRYESFAIRKISVINLSLLATVVMASPHWLWYGEKYGINAIILWVIFSFVYRISLGLSRKPFGTVTDILINAKYKVSG